jgi:hypothetical protein
MDTMVKAVTLTLAEAAMVLDPPVTEQQLRAIVRALGWQAAGVRHGGHPGRPGRQQATFDAADVLRLHAALVPFLRSS